jgi:hypothetical protein
MKRIVVIGVMVLVALTACKPARHGGPAAPHGGTPVTKCHVGCR